MSPSKPLPPGRIPLRERRSLAEEWETFNQNIIPKMAGPTQRAEMKRAFYAGAIVIFSLMSGGLDPDEEPTQLDIKYVDSLFEEIVEYTRKEGLK
jgi:hypothetical protein